MNRPTTFFEQVPLALVKKLTQEKSWSSAANIVSCVICGTSVELEHCKINEDGRAVHENCYIEKLALPMVRAKVDRFSKPLLS
jgi:hypothetical protein